MIPTRIVCRTVFPGHFPLLYHVDWTTRYIAIISMDVRCRLQFDEPCMMVMCRSHLLFVSFDMWLFIYLFSSLLLASFYILNRFKTNGTCLLYSFGLSFRFYHNMLAINRFKTENDMFFGYEGWCIRTRENRLMVVVASSSIPSSSWNPICSNRFLPARRRRPGCPNYAIARENSPAALQLLYSRVERYPNLEFLVQRLFEYRPF